MKNLKKVIVAFLIFCLLIINLVTVSHAEPVKVTKENLTQAFEEMEKLFINEEGKKDIEITVLDDIIEVSIYEEKYKMSYDLTNKPTFSLEASITQGMTYEEFQNQVSGGIVPIMLSYAAVANVQGAKLEDAIAYILFDMFEEAFSEIPTIPYVIVDDTKSSITNNNLTGKKIIYVSEFGDHVMEYVNTLTNIADNTITDSDGLNSYVYNEEQKDVTETSCKLVSTLTINTDADFSKIKEIVDEIGNSINGSINNSIGNLQNSIGSTILNTSNTGNITNTTNIINKLSTSNVMNITNLPQTGEGFKVTDLLVTIIVVSIIGLVALHINKKKNYTE